MKGLSSPVFFSSSLGVLLFSWIGRELEPIGANVNLFIGTFGMTMLCCYLAWRFRPVPFNGLGWALLILVSIFSRFILLPMEMSDDVYRYAWEGYALKKGHNPYAVVPANEKLQFLNEWGFQLPNHPDLGAIYPPLALYFHMLLIEAHPVEGPGGRIAAETGELNPQVQRVYFSFKYAYTILDLLTLLLLFLLLRARGEDCGHGILYAFNPVILYSYASQGHLDSLMIFLLVFAFLLYEKRSFFLMWISLALAIASKGPAILAMIALLKRNTIRSFWILPMVLCFLYLPFLETPSSWFRSLVTFGSQMSYNSSIFPLVQYLTSLGNQEVTLILILVGISILFWVYLCCSDPPRCAFIVLTLFLLLAPTVHFWYLGWLVPFLCFYRNGPIILWCGMAGMWFVVLEGMHDQNIFQHYPVYTALQYIPVYIYLLSNWLGYTMPLIKKNKRDSKAISLGVVIPVLNEESNLRGLLREIELLEEQPEEMVIVDGGSSDRTLEVAKEFGIRVVNSPKGRGNQIQRGVEQCLSEAVLILHADCRMEVEVIAKVKEGLLDPEVLGGCVGSRFESPSCGQWIIQFLNIFRARILGMSFGDQGQFFRTRFIKEGKWDLSMPLMEDVELSLCFWQTPGVVLYLGGGLVSSVRRWKKSNRFLNALGIIHLVLLYCIKRKIQGRVDTRRLYERYYGKALA